MNLVQGYGIAVTWAITFMVLAFIVRWIFKGASFPATLISAVPDQRRTNREPDGPWPSLDG